MTSAPKPSLATARETAHDQRTELVKTMVAKENAAPDAKTARLKALRLAQEAKAPPKRR